MSPRVKPIAALLIAGCAGSAVTAAIAYRHSTDGEMATLWFRIIWSGLLALAALRFLDSAVHALARTVRRLHARLSA